MDHRIAVVLALSCVLNFVALAAIVQLKRQLGMVQSWQSVQADRLHVLRIRLSREPFGLPYQDGQERHET